MLLSQVKKKTKRNLHHRPHSMFTIVFFLYPKYHCSSTIAQTHKQTAGAETKIDIIKPHYVSTKFEVTQQN